MSQRGAFFFPVLAVLLLTPPSILAESKPNIVIIYADDLGYGDVQCYNPDRGRIPTPHIDRIASQGMRFTCLLYTSDAADE